MKEPTFDELKARFKKELEGISDLETLKDVYAAEIAKRDKLILELQRQNELVLKSAFRAKNEELSDK